MSTTSEHPHRALTDTTVGSKRVVPNPAENGPALRLSDFDVQSRDVVNFIHIPKNAGTSFKALCGRQLVYHNHSVDVRSPHIPNQLIILRDPVARFVSAFYYSIEYYRHHTHIRDLYYHHIVSPNRLIEILSEPNHPFRPKTETLLANDGTQRIGSYTSPHKWIYSPQSLYVHEPKYVILFENLHHEWALFSDHHQLDLPKLSKTNTTKKRQHEPLTQQSIDFIRAMYAEDIKTVDRFRAMPVETRLGGLSIAPHPVKP